MGAPQLQKKNYICTTNDLVMANPLNKAIIVGRLQQQRSKLKDFGVLSIGLFGSYVKDQATENSDVDVIVDIRKEKKTLLNFMALAYFLEDVLGKKVDLITLQSLSPHIGPHILNTVEYVAFSD